MAGQAALTPLAYGISEYDNEDFTAADAMFNIAVGGMFGGGLHTSLHFLGHGAPGLSDRLEAARPETRDALLRGSIASLVDGAPVSIRPEIASSIPRVEDVPSFRDRIAGDELQPTEPYGFANVEAPTDLMHAASGTEPWCQRACSRRTCGS